MTAKVTPELAQELRRTHEGKLVLYKEVLEGKGAFFDAVVITAADAEQTATYEANIEAFLAEGRIPKTAKYVVCPDPPGRKVGCGGATFYVLAELEKRYGAGAATLRVLLIHAGGYSKRLPNHSHCGKIYSLLPVPSPANPKAAMSMLELKLATFAHVAQQIPETGGVFVTCSDDLIFYDHALCDFSLPGFTALGHPSPVSVGKDHGVFVLQRAGTAGPSPCKKFLHKKSVEQQRAEGAVVGKTTDGEDEVFTDSCYFFSSDVSSALLAAFRKLGGTVKAEVDAYGDFMQCTGSERSKQYMEDFGNTAKTDEEERRNLLEVREVLYDALSPFPLNCLCLPGSRFYHVGTMREALYHFCEDEGFLTCLGRPGGVPAGGACIIESLVAEGAAVEGPSVVEYSRLAPGCTVGPRSILSGVTVPAGTTLPPGVFIQTLPVRGAVTGSGQGIRYVTHILGTGDDIKKDMGGNVRIFGGEFSVSDYLKGCAGSIWSAKMYPVMQTAAESFDAALAIYSSVAEGKAPSCWSGSHRLVSLAECVTGKALEAQAASRRQLLSEL